MSRSGYSDECDGWDLIRWRGAVNSAIRGARGQAMLRELLAALDAMQDKILAAESLVTQDGEFCTLGVLGNARGMDLTAIDPEDRQAVAQAFGVAEALAAEIMYQNDDGTNEHTWIEVEFAGPVRPHYPEYGRHTRTVRVSINDVQKKRWRYMRAWVATHLVEAKPA